MATTPMRVTGLGHAGLKLQTSAGAVLVDPWFAPDGAFLASWFPFPDNTQMLDASRHKPNAIIITHEHLDHLDPWFLATVEANVPVVTCKYPGSAVRRKVLASGP